MKTHRKRAPRLEDLIGWLEPDASEPQLRPSERDLPRAELKALDERLARLSRNEGRTYLHLGDLLERFSRLGGPGIYGYSSRGNYAAQVLGRGSRWAGDRCALSRAVEQLLLIRAALAMGRIGRLLAKYAEPEDEAELLLEAQGQTVRAMRAWLAARARDQAAAERARGEAGDEAATAEPEDGAEPAGRRGW